ncbi:proline/serine-rich coiled-coil protein 1 isoform X1 [Antechinus flavipes]|uniref:proline/serine-rich coiled-coil protein 1 isoform X1 n=3 Tax=Antechinus flavipes TaxID=38775 RepID=UPI0022367E3A|nr:proline/serine-rich coiled-coil protein 1 isoform X1 [Antechinus flavipes]XP_051849115.1 proline/serine-rich coiled-coil protein 1 isoform X1 [Antechinus flavipes]
MENLEEDIMFIVDETLDFSVPSPSDSREEEEAAEPVIPERPPRRGLAHRSDMNTVAEEPQGLRLSLGPLSPEKLEEILAEANRLAARLEQCALQERDTPDDGKGRRVKASPRRETFVVKNSPVRALLPTVSSSIRGASSLGGLSPRLRSNEKKASSKALRAVPGKKPSSTKKEVPTGSVLPSARSQSSPLSRITPPARGKVGPSGRAPVAGSASTTRPALTLQLPPSTLQRPARTQGPASRPSKLPTPTAIPKPASQALLSSRSPLSGKGSLPPESTPPRKGPLRPSAAGHRVSAPQKSSLPVSAASRNHLQFPKKVMTSGLTRGT